MQQSTSTAILLSLALASSAAFTSAQQLADPRTDTTKSGQGDESDANLPRPVEQGVGDVNALGTSLRRLEAGLEIPTGFSDVFNVPGRPGWRMRVDGGLYAVFPQSVYLEDGVVIPNDTIFYIGRPTFMSQPVDGPGAAPAALTELPGDGFVQRTLLRRADGTDLPHRANRTHTRDVAQLTASTIVYEGEYRRRRLVALMDRAARAGRNREQAAQPEEPSDIPGEGSVDSD